MKYVLILALCFTFFSCEKDGETCYECQEQQGNNASYYDVGCFSKEDWDNASVADLNGNILNKQTQCRAK